MTEHTSTQKLLIAVPFDGRIQSLVIDDLVQLSGHLYNNGGPDVSVQEYQRLTGKPFKAVTDAEFDALLEEHNHREYLDKPATLISEERFHNMLDVLPPKNWVHTKDFERFNLIEHLTGTITEQLVRYKDKYLALYVDAADPSTWVTRDNVQAKIDQAWPSERAA